MRYLRTGLILAALVATSGLEARNTVIQTNTDPAGTGCGAASPVLIYDLGTATEVCFCNGSSVFECVEVGSGAGGSGEDNTASNVGGGTGIFKQKTGVDLEFKTFVTGTGLTFGTSGPNGVKYDLDLTAGHTWTAATEFESILLSGPPIIDVTHSDYGATCDGVTDDTAALDLARDAWTAGAVIYIPESAGCCMTDGWVFDETFDGLTIRGDGYDSCVKLNTGSVGGDDSPVKLNKNGASLLTLDNVTLSNFRIEGDPTLAVVSDYEVLDGEDLVDALFERMWFRNAAADCVDLDGGNDHVRILNSTFEGCGGNGLHCYGCNDLLFSGNYLTDVAKDTLVGGSACIDILDEQQNAVHVSNATNVRVIGNTCRDVAHGIQTSKCDSCVIGFNTLDDVDSGASTGVADYGAGVMGKTEVGTTNSVSVIGNLIRTTAADGIWGDFDHVVGNTIIDAAEDGIYVSGTGGGVWNVAGNVIKNATGNGIVITKPSHVHGNTINDSGDQGIEVTNTGDGSVVEGNWIDTTVDHGISFTVADGSVARGNTVISAGTYGIYSNASTGLSILGNYVDSPGTESAIACISAARCVLEGNIAKNATTSGKAGLYVSASTDARMADNYSYNNNRGLWLAGASGGTEVTNNTIIGATTDFHNTATGTITTWRPHEVALWRTCGTVASASTIALESCNTAIVNGSSTVDTINTCDSANTGRGLWILPLTTVTFGDGTGNLRLVGGNYSPAVGNAVLHLVCDGTNWREVARAENG